MFCDWMTLKIVFSLSYVKRIAGKKQTNKQTKTSMFE